MRRKITFFDVLANNETSAHAAKRLMEDFGYQVNYRDEPSFAACLKQFYQLEHAEGNGDEALKVLAMLHPDRELILSTANKSELRGVDGFTETIPALAPVPPSITKAPKKPAQDYTPVLAIGLLAAALLLSSAIISKK